MFEDKSCILVIVLQVILAVQVEGGLCCSFVMTTLEIQVAVVLGVKGEKRMTEKKKKK